MTESMIPQRRRWLVAGCVLALSEPFRANAAQSGFDHNHAAWDALLQQHVKVARDGRSSAVDYAAFKRQRAQLQDYLNSLSAVSRQQYQSWSKAQQLAFLINAYNAFTVELILTRYPDLQSIKDLGKLFQSPWKKSFFSLLGKERNLDEIEHDLIREPGVFDDPRIHFAVNCASIGCPMLRDQAFVPDRLDAQLEDSTRRFLSDHSRNRYQAGSGLLAVSKIFDWYRNDFEQGHQGIDSLNTLFSRYAKQLADTPAGQADVRAGRYQLGYLDYDWALNNVRR